MILCVGVWRGGREVVSDVTRSLTHSLVHDNSIRRSKPPNK